MQALGADLQKQLAKGTGLGLWSGTITIEQRASGDHIPPSDIIHSDRTTTALDQQVSLTVTGGKATAKVSYDLKQFTTMTSDYDSNVVTGTEQTLTTASEGGVAANFNVAFYDDGSYELEFSADGVRDRWTKEVASKVTCKPGVDPQCRDSNTRDEESADLTNLGQMSDAVRG